jgi:hypothetical protein
MTDLFHSERSHSLRDLSPFAQHTAAWLRALARGLKMFRLYRHGNPVVLEARQQIAARLIELLNQHGAMDLRFTPTEILLKDESVVRPGANQEDNLRASELQLPFQFYRDGIRRLLILPEIPLDQVLLLMDGLRATGVGPETHDDLVTLLWQGNLTHLQLETVPIEQTIYLSVRRTGGDGGGHPGLSYAWSPAGSEVRADLGQTSGPQGLHRDTFDDWELPRTSVEVPSAYAELERSADIARSALLADWQAESARPWPERTPDVVRQLLELDPGDATRMALVSSLVSWVGGALQRCEWEEAQRALLTLLEIDPQHRWSEEPLTRALSGFNAAEIAERLDEDEPADHARFSSLMVAIGRPALDLACCVMCMCLKVRPRAAASTAVCFLCSEHPEWLAPYVADSRWQMVRNVVFALGQIGGDEIVPLLRAASQHPEVRVRRATVQALGGVTTEMRTPLLLEQLSTRDPQLLAASLNMLTRERDPHVARAILARIQASDFESRSEDNQRALFSALAELADDRMIPALEHLLHEGGWFARRTVVRVAAARTLRRIGTEPALAALEAGLRSKSDAVRAACLDAMSSRMSP